MKQIEGHVVREQILILSQYRNLQSVRGAVPLRPLRLSRTNVHFKIASEVNDFE